MKPSMKTEAFEEWRKSRLESALEDLYYNHPYLIDLKLSNPKRQIAVAPDSRTDLLFEFPRLAWVVEIKKGKAGVLVVRQIERYLRLLETNFPKVKGTIVALDLTPAGFAALETSAYTINFKKLIVDVPIEVKFCRSCRKAYDSRKTACPGDGEKATL